MLGLVCGVLASAVCELVEDCMSLLGIVVIVCGLLLSVGLHELGHMLPAKKFGVPVPVFSLGFGPVLWQRRWGSTVYRVSVIPLGGYVRIAGMFAPARAGQHVRNRRGELSLAEEARRSSAQELPVGAEDRAFYRLSAPKKVAVMFGGPLMNLVLAFVLFVVALVGVGVPTPSTVLGAVEASTPAAVAGLEVGDRIVRVGGREIRQWSDISQVMQGADGSAVEVEFERDSQVRQVSITPVLTGSGRWIFGVVGQIDYRSASVGDVFRVMGQSLVGTAAIVVRFPLAVWDVAVSLVTGGPRDGSGMMSIVGVGRLAGEVTSGEAVALPQGMSSWRAIVGTLLLMLASLNVALFTFNMLPVPPLDGGHIVGAVFEGVRRQCARVRGQADPGPADTARLVPLTYVVGALLLVMTVVLIVADIVQPVSLGG